MEHLLNGLELLLKPAAILSGAALAGYALHAVSYFALNRAVLKTESVIDDAMVKHTRGPARPVIILLFVNFVLPFIQLGPSLNTAFGHFVTICWIISAAWLIIRLPEVLKMYLLEKYNIKEKNNLEARKIFTQFRVFQKIVVFIAVTLAFAAILMDFDKVRSLGTSILASAGIIGIIAGFAGQKIIANLFAGLQIAFAQPLRIDDVVVVENEWGRVEDITLTHVVIKIWDLRRLVVPISYFIDKPFQNWTKHTSDVLGTVFIYTDYSVPVQAVRDRLYKILEGSRHWNNKEWGLEVTNSNERCVEMRALMGAEDSSAAWNLRCEVREKLIDFIQRSYPDSLPKQRVEVSGSADKPFQK